MSSSDDPARESAIGAEAKGGLRGSKPLPCGLYVTATPIGNARDLSLRAIDVLARVDAVAAEDTRVTGKLLSLHGLKAKLVSYREDNADRATPDILARLGRGEAVALVTDAGTPHVSDPGTALVAAVADAGHPVFAVPGASALTAALSISGIAAKRTLFCGFLPAFQSPRRAELSALKSIDAALVFFEAPHRIVETLSDLAEILGPRPAALCREITKLHEEVRRGTLADLAAAGPHDENLQRGEIVLVVGPPLAEDSATTKDDLDAALRRALSTMRVKDAADAVAGALSLPRRQVYARALELKEHG